MAPAATGAFAQRYWGLPGAAHSMREMLAWCRCRTINCRGAARRDWCPDGSGQSAQQDAIVLRMQMSQVRRGRAARDGHHGHVRGFVVVLPALRVPGCEHHGRCACELLAARGPVHRRHRTRHPAPAVLALLDQGHARHEARRDRRAIRQPAHAGHGACITSITASPHRAAAITSTPRMSRCC
jgi:hypothetical protein